GEMAAAALGGPAGAGAAPSLFTGGQHAISFLGSTAPAQGRAQGDQNPYGVAVVPTTMGALERGGVLVSNFNDAANHQGTGSSIVEISPSGSQRLFAVVPQPTATPAVGLT